MYKKHKYEDRNLTLHSFNIFVLSFFRTGFNSFPNSILIQIKTKNEYVRTRLSDYDVAFLVNEGFRTVYCNLFFQCHS